jgi:hypothetical protein
MVQELNKRIQAPDCDECGPGINIDLLEIAELMRCLTVLDEKELLAKVRLAMDNCLSSLVYITGEMKNVRKPPRTEDLPYT